jgi:hypothetical protein
MMAGQSDAGRIVLRLLESGERPLRSVLHAVDKSASGKAKQVCLPVGPSFLSVSVCLAAWPLLFCPSSVCELCILYVWCS